jgi:hypothetical protein
MVASGELEGIPQVAESRETSPRQFSLSSRAGFSSPYPMLTCSMTPLTGSSSLRTSSAHEKISFSAQTPQVKEIAGVDLVRTSHSLIPWMIHQPDASKAAGTVTGMEHAGIDWISANHWQACGSRALRLAHNATPLWLKPWGNLVKMENLLDSIVINDGDLVINAPRPGISIPIAGRYFPPGSLQILYGQDGLQVTNASTTLPKPERVDTNPCNGWCRKQHIYCNNGMTETAVVYFNSYGWPVACKENVLEPSTGLITNVGWWRFDYSRPQPAIGVPT